MATKPLRCSKHKTAMHVIAQNGFGWLELECCLRGCGERQSITEVTYREIYGEPPPKVEG